MDRRVIGFVALLAVGGCVSDDQGTTASILAARQGQPIFVPAPPYASWSKGDQFAVLQDGQETARAPQPGLPAPRTNTTTSLKLPARKLPAAPAPAPAVQLPAAPAIDAALVDPPPADPVPAPGPRDHSEPEPPAVPAPAPVVVHASAPAVIPAPAPSAVPTPTVAIVPAPTPAAVPAPEPTAPPTPAPIIVQALTPARENPAAPSSGPNLDVEKAVVNRAGPAIRWVNSKRITLNYELKDVGVASVSGVELWCTQDTRTWKKGEIIAQTDHSFSVEVKDEGLYGFTLLTRNDSSGAKDAPQPGDQPQMWVLVDVTKPVVQITSVELTNAGVLIRWTAKDKHLPPRPIVLSYAEQPEGPWTPLIDGLENNGQYSWQPPAGVPHSLFIRVEAVDLGGNVGGAQTGNPLRLDPAVAAAAPPSPEAAHRPPTSAAPPVLEAPPRPSAAILAVEPNRN